jgi:tyrosine-protein kinase Etk/Wzc
MGTSSVGLLGFLTILASYKRMIIGVPLIAGLVAAVFTYLLPNVYTATAKILPPQQASSSAASALLGQLGGIAGMNAQSMGLKNPGDLYVGMLQSRTVADDLIKRFQLQDVYATKTMVETRAALAKASSLRAGRDGMVTIEVDDTDPKRAADLANGYVDALDKLTQSIAVTEAAQRRLFLERQLRHAKDKLADAEVGLSKIQEATGLITLQEQGKAIIEAVANLRAQIAGKEIQISAMRSFATETNPQYRRAREELLGMRAELGKLDKASPDDRVLLTTGRVPQAGLEYIRGLREVKYHETLFELVARQYELAKGDEAKENGVIQTVDKAVEPDRKSKPQRTLVVVTIALFFGFFSVLAALAIEMYGKDPSDRAQWKELRRSIFTR